MAMTTDLPVRLDPSVGRRSGLYRERYNATERLCRTIRLYWLDRGYAVEVFPAVIPATDQVVVQSNLINGRPVDWARAKPMTGKG